MIKKKEENWLVNENIIRLILAEKGYRKSLKNDNA